jgi:branched-chain amino acid transport system permease protein
MAALFENNKRIFTVASTIIVILVLVAVVGPALTGPRPYRLVQSSITGVLVGGVYALVALGIVIINKSSGVFNFAHGWMMLVGGLIFYSFFVTTEISMPVAFVMALVTMSLAVSTSASDKERLAFGQVRQWVRKALPIPILGFVISLILWFILRVLLGIFIQAYTLLKTPQNRLIALGGVIALTVLMTMSADLWNWLRILVAAGVLLGALAILYLRYSKQQISPALAVLGAVVTVIVAWLLFTSQANWIHAIVGATLGAVLLGLMVERFTIRPLIGQPLFAMVLMTLAVADVIHGFAQVTWGSVELTLPTFTDLNVVGLPQVVQFDSRASFGEEFGGPIRVETPRLLAFGLGLAAFAVFVVFFRYTSIGLAMRAVSENQQLAQSVGLRVRVILAVAWGIAALLAATAGMLQGGATTLSLNLPFIVLRAFPAVLLGGLESIGGALLGGIVIGVTEEMADLLFRGSQVGTELAPYVVLMIVLVIRPEGLFGQKRIERI